MTTQRGGLRELALFAGAGGGILGGQLLGWRTVCAVEVASYCRSVLLSRQRDGCLPVFPVWDDVRTFDGTAWRGHVDVISGGFPCQDISSLGKRAGLDGDKSGLWHEFARIIEEVRPAHVFIENSPHLRTRGLVTVLQDLARVGFDAKWGVLGASDIGAPHKRKRMWIVANANMRRERVRSEHAETSCAPPAAEATGGFMVAANSNREDLRLQQGRGCGPEGEDSPIAGGPGWWPLDFIKGMDDGLANRVERIAATGNGQVPAVAAMAWRTLTEAYDAAHNQEVVR